MSFHFYCCVCFVWMGEKKEMGPIYCWMKKKKQPAVFYIAFEMTARVVERSRVLRKGDVYCDVVMHATLSSTILHFLLFTLLSSLIQWIIDCILVVVVVAAIGYRHPLISNTCNHFDHCPCHALSTFLNYLKKFYWNVYFVCLVSMLIDLFDSWLELQPFAKLRWIDFDYQLEVRPVNCIIRTNDNTMGSRTMALSDRR